MSDELAEALRAGMPRWVGCGDALLIRLESFLQITGRSLGLEDIGTDKWRTVWMQFSAVLHVKGSQGTITADTAYNLHRRCVTLLKTLGDASLDSLKFPFNGGPTEQINTLVTNVTNASITERVEYWRGWTAKNKLGKEIVFRLYPLYDRVGKEFTTNFFLACEAHVLTGLSTSIPYVNDIARYIGDYQGEISAESFQDRHWLSEFLERFCVAAVHEKHENHKQLYSATRSWSKFAHFLDQCVIGQIWAELGRPIPRPKAPAVKGDQTRVIETSEGLQVRRTLLTDVPLYVPDSEAKELLFREIQSDFDAIVRWARKEVQDAWARRNNRLALSPEGIVSHPGPSGKNSGLDWRLTKNCPTWLAHAAATFESRGLVIGQKKPTASAYYPSPLDETAWDLGIPTPNLLLAHAAVLIAKHPQITPSFLERLEIYDRNDQKTGLVETDAGHYLVGVKSRKGGRTAEQVIKLDDETTEVVRQVIDLTQPLRYQIKAAKSPTWRRLFLATPSMGSTPKFWCASSTANRSALWLCGRLTQCAEIEPYRAYEIAKRFSLRGLRASAAVLVYIKSGSLEEFSKTLGHEECKPELLDSYLPRPIQEFFVDRWVRIFQIGIIVEVMRDSEVLHQASGFNTMEELDLFLEHHALRSIPKHLSQPEYLPAYKSADALPQTKLVIGLDQEILTILVSMNSVVKDARREVDDRAIRWAAFCDHLIEFIETDEEKPELKDMLTYASANADGKKVEHLIYA
ncbi:hypothetical protein ACQQ2N_06865 [Dokdonella sp. MW10]|uniref:hypothetical protein n=1 Tax=Dokdonella sp. MW10 TaxID=2992926 RepID=UPI003F811A43